jgi:serine/threonine-protein kinase
LRPVIGAMLQANPANRLRSMADVVDALANPGGLIAPTTTPVEKQQAPAKVEKPVRTEGASGSVIAGKMPLIAGGVAAAALLAAVGVYLASGPSAPAPTTAAETPSTRPAPTDPAAAARAALNASLPSIACTWLDVVSIAQGVNGPVVALRGVAGKPAEAQGQIARILSGAGVPNASLDFSDVSPIEESECGPLEAFRQIRDAAGGGLTSAQRQFEMSTLDTGEYAGQLGAKAVINFNLPDMSREYAVFGLEPEGQITQLTRTTAELAVRSERIEPNQFRLTIDVNHKGWSGMLLLSGRRPLDAAFIAGPAGSRTPAWADRFRSAATTGGWKAEMVWFKTVDDQPN